MLGKYAPKQTRDLGNNKKTRKSPSRKPSLDDNVNRNPGSHNKGTKGKRKQSKIGNRLASLTRKYGSQNVVKMLKLPAAELRKFERNKKTIKSRSREPYTLIPSLDEGVNRNPGSHQNKGTDGKKKQYMIGEKLVSKARKLESHKGGKMLGKYAAKLRKDFENNKKTRKSPSRKPSLDDNVNRNPGSHNKGTEGKRRQSMIGKMLVSKAREYGSHKGGEMLGKYAPKQTRDFGNNKKTRKSPSRKPSLDDNVNRNPGSHQNKGTEGKRKRSKISKTVTSEVRKYGSSKFGEMLGKYGPYKSLTDPKTKYQRKSIRN
nr:uncharacterized protein LOC113805261 [Penaeus vannamei]